MKARLSMSYEFKVMTREAYEDVMKFHGRRIADELYRNEKTHDRVCAYVCQNGFCMFTGRQIPREAISDVESQTYRLVEFSSPSHCEKIILLVEYNEAEADNYKINKDLVDDMLTIKTIRPEYYDMLVSDDVEWTLVDSSKSRTGTPIFVEEDIEDEKEEVKKKEIKATADNGWICSKCLTQNTALRMTCSECGTSISENKSILTEGNLRVQHVPKLNLRSQKVMKIVNCDKKEDVSKEKQGITEEKEKPVTTGTEAKRRKRGKKKKGTNQEIKKEEEKPITLQEFKERREVKDKIVQNLYTVNENTENLPDPMKKRVLKVLNAIDAIPAEMFYKDNIEIIELYSEQLGYCLYTGEDIDLSEVLYNDDYCVHLTNLKNSEEINDRDNKILVYGDDEDPENSVDKYTVEEMKFMWLLLNSYGLISDKKITCLFSLGAEK